MKRLDEVVPRLRRLLAGILPRQARAFAVGDLPTPVAAATAALLAEDEGRRALLIAPAPDAAEQAASDAALLLPGLPILPLSPADDEAALLTGERVAQVRAILAAKGPCLIVASVHALLQPVPDPQALDAASKTLRLNADFPFDTLAETLTTLGYAREELVADPLTFALRGGILDVWPAGAERPVRAEFFGDTVDGLRAFDPGFHSYVHIPLTSLNLGSAQSYIISARNGSYCISTDGGVVWTELSETLQAQLKNIRIADGESYIYIPNGQEVVFSSATV